MEKPTTGAEIVQGLVARFKPEVAGSYSGIVHYDLSGDGGGQFTLTIDNGSCKVEPGLQGSPKCVFKSAAQTFADIEWGRTKPEMAYLTGKIKIQSPQEMLRIVKFFTLLHD